MGFIDAPVDKIMPLAVGTIVKQQYAYIFVNRKTQSMQNTFFSRQILATCTLLGFETDGLFVFWWPIFWIHKSSTTTTITGLTFQVE